MNKIGDDNNKYYYKYIKYKNKYNSLKYNFDASLEEEEEDLDSDLGLDLEGGNPMLKVILRHPFAALKGHLAKKSAEKTIMNIPKQALDDALEKNPKKKKGLKKIVTDAAKKVIKNVKTMASTAADVAKQEIGRKANK